MNLILEKFTVLGSFGPVIFFLLRLLPYTLMWALFTFLYIFMPNTQVKFSVGLIAGIITGTIFQVVEWAYITFQIGVAQYNAIYGSFAALPLFLAWLQLSWLIVLYGAELSFAYQNVETYEFEPDALAASHRLRTLLSLRITHHLVQRFVRGEKPATARDISNQLEIPIRFVNEILFNLVKSDILSMARTEGSEEQGYQPARDVSTLTVQYVIGAMDKRGLNQTPFTQSPEFAALSASLETFDQTMARQPENKLLKDL
ncbi:MAG: ribonuclease BN/unknown domain fusion protein [Deltaproteobacteria bacterium ADurb.Bin002]|nr:MAG: ribonuclease BN/unknown domain fusion protein [Deltaproteobacteria bacterium ADurb.Bin002]